MVTKATTVPLSFRDAVFEVVGGWMVTLMDRYSYFHRLLPLILTGMEDEVGLFTRFRVSQL